MAQFYAWKSWWSYALDIDECTTRNECKFNQICTNTPGSYQCSCPRGLRSSGPNRPCVGESMTSIFKGNLVDLKRFLCCSVPVAFDEPGVIGCEKFFIWIDVLNCRYQRVWGESKSVLTPVSQPARWISMRLSARTEAARRSKVMRRFDSEELLISAFC